MKKIVLGFLLCMLAIASRCEIVINEVCVSNTRDIDRSFNYGGWVELYNSDNAAQDLYGFYFSDDPSVLRKFRILKHVMIPAKGYAVFYCGGPDTLQLNFDLDVDGGRVFFADRIGRKKSEVEYPIAMSNISYARTSDGGGNWSFCAYPTLGSSNNGAMFASERCPEPIFSVQGGLFEKGVDVVELGIDCPDDMEIRYTTDCTEPTRESTVWKKGMIIDKTCVVRAAVMGDGYLPSRTVTQSFIFTDHRHSLPVVSMVTDPKNLWNAQIGIYCTGTNGIPGNGQDLPQNYNQDWQRPANFEYIKEGETVLSQPCDIAISGGWSRSSKLKSLKLVARKKYDEMNSFDYPFFEAKPGLKYKSLLLRNSGNDWSNSMMKDALLQQLVAEVMDVEYQAYQPTVYYMNGEYYGIINLRERNNTQYVYSNFGMDEEEIDMIEKVPYSSKLPTGETFEIKAGDTKAIDELLVLAERIEEPGVYEQICEQVDIDGLINYLMLELWTGNWDWPQNNIKFFRHREGGKFRWITYDLENGFGDMEFNHFTDSEYGFSGSKAYDGHTSRLIVALLRNEDFVNALVDNMCICMGSVFLPDRFDAIADSIYGLIVDELPYNNARWGTTGNVPYYVNSFKNFNRSRQNRMLEQLRNRFALGEAHQLTVASDQPHATLFLNDQPLPLGYMQGYSFADREITVRAIPPVGYRFRGWSTSLGMASDVFPLGSVWYYNDEGGLYDDAWKEISDVSWNRGDAPLGYGKDGIATTVSYGRNENNKFVTTYFRKSFTLREYAVTNNYGMELLVDDGAIVYINGIEVYRHLMPSGEIDPYTVASTYASGNPDRVSFMVPTSVLQEGTNIVAIEVHQNSRTSSDIYMDARLYEVKPDESSLITSEEHTFVMDGPMNLQALFAPISEKEQRLLPPIRINEICLSNATYLNDYYLRNDWIELYNTTGKAVSLGGLYVTDDPDDPRAYCIPDLGEQTTIPPYGYYILWADKLPSFIELHLPFKLSSSGDFIMISSFDAKGDMVWADSLYVGAIGKNVSYGRYPNGADSLYVLNRMTFADANYYSSYNLSVRYDASVTSVGTSPWNDALTMIEYDGEKKHLLVSLIDADLPALLNVFDVSGRMELSQSLNSSHEVVDVSHLSDGVYIVCAAGKTLKIRISN